jgi:hypothetical protein
MSRCRPRPRLLHLELLLALALPFFLGQEAAAQSSCDIEGPSIVGVDTTFRLCGPFGEGVNYSWDGPNIVGDQNERCVYVQNLDAGTYRFRLTTRRNGVDSLCFFDVHVIDRLQCRIDGPAAVDSFSTFQLCGPELSGSTYAWSGWGILSGDSSRCVTIGHLAPGMYTFTLRTSREGRVRECRYDLVVVSSLVDCAITGPAYVGVDSTFALCGPAGKGEGVAWYWTGPNLTGETFHRCVTVGGLPEGTHRFTLQITQQGNITTQCTFDVVAIERRQCFISGPTQVTTDTSFRLCGPAGDGLSYWWTGPNIVGPNDSRCILIQDLPVATHRFTLRVTRNGADSLCWIDVRVTDPLRCRITGPTVVDSFATFTLCGPEHAGYRYQWSGPHLNLTDTLRCVTIQRLVPYTYTYTLAVTFDNQTKTCTHDLVVVSSAAPCAITGPAFVGTDSAFTLCGPSGDSLSWSWSGPNLTGDTHARCVTIGGLGAGTHQYTLALTRMGSTSTCTFEVRALDRGGLDCVISGPTRVAEGESFSLCGPTGTAIFYSWAGPGISKFERFSRCVAISGLSAGSYSYVLRIASLRGTRMCTFTVEVVPGGGPPTGVCPRSFAFWKKQCREVDRGRSDVLDQQQLTRVAQCVDDRTTAFTWNSDLSSFCSLAGVPGWDPKNRVRHQFAVLLANLCANEMGLTDDRGRRIGLDPSARINCRVLDARTVGELVPRIEILLARYQNASLLDWSMWRNLGPVAECLASINRGQGVEGRRCTDDDGESAPAAELESNPTPAGVELERPTPNPFSTSTRLSYAVERSGDRVEIAVHDVSGRLVRRLVGETQSAGVHEIRWEGIDASGSRVQPGVYFVRGRIGTRVVNVRVTYVP